MQLTKQIKTPSIINRISLKSMYNITCSDQDKLITTCVSTQQTPGCDAILFLSIIFNVDILLPLVEFSRLHNLYAWYWNLPGENSAFVHFAAALIANHYNSDFLFHQVPITAGLTEAA